MNIFIDQYQQSQVQEGTAATDGKLPTAERSVRPQDLERRIETLAIACQALWEILREEFKLTDSAILAKMQQIDLRDGKADGKLAPGLVACPKCSRDNRATRRICLYCGGELAG